jgi:hypothetical protein
MSKRCVPDSPPSMAMELFQPKPNVLYSLDETAHLAGIPRRSILIYCRAGLIQPVVQPPYGVMEFTEEAIYTMRRIEHLRTVHGCAPSCVFCVTIEKANIHETYTLWRKNLIKPIS